MDIGSIAALGAAILLLLAVLGFGHGLWLVVNSAVKATRIQLQKKPLLLVVTRRSDHGSYFQIDLARRSRILQKLLPLPQFQAGMYLTLLIPDEQDPRTRVSRRYSLSAWCPKPHLYELAIKREQEGKVSNWLSRHATLGQTLEVLPPQGDFVLNSLSQEPLLFVAAGIGITPLRAMVQQAVYESRATPLTLVWSVRHTEEWMDYHAQFEQLAQASTHFKYIPVLTGANTSAWAGERSRVDADRLLRWVNVSKNQTNSLRAFMCASVPMMESLSHQLAVKGIPQSRIHYEAFAAAANQDKNQYQVTVLPQGLSFAFKGESSLLHALSSNRIAIGSDCRNGTCGACKVKLIAGNVRAAIEPEWPLKPGELLTCCSVPETDLVLEIPST